MNKFYFNRKYAILGLMSFLGFTMFVIAIFQALLMSTQVEAIPLTQAQQSMLEAEFKQDLGEEVTTLLPGKLKVQVWTPNRDISGIRFYNDLGYVDEPVTLVCNARTQTLSVFHQLKFKEYADAYATQDFSIRHYRKGTTTIYEADEERIKIFSTVAGDRDLKTAMSYINDLPDDDLISLAVEEPVVDSEYLSFASAYSPLYTVKEFKYALRLIDLNNCQDVVLRNKPVFDKEA